MIIVCMPLDDINKKRSKDSEVYECLKACVYMRVCVSLCVCVCVCVCTFKCSPPISNDILSLLHQRIMNKLDFTHVFMSA